ncbi:MAG: S8 family serine peptidase [Candidatus Bipolaricaulaceae bacterium]
MKKGAIFVILLILSGLVLAGCAYLGSWLSGQNLSDTEEIWIAPGAFADFELSPMAVDGGAAKLSQYIPGQLIVKFKPGKYGDAAINTLCAKHSLQLKGRINQLRLVLVQLPSGADLEEAKVKLAAEPDVESVGLNYVYQLLGRPVAQSLEPKHITNDPWMPLWQWGLFAIDFHKIAATVLPTSAPMIAVVDTGVDYNHPDLKGKVTKGPDYYDGDMDPMDTTGHGTHVAGIAAAITDNNTGVAGVSGKSMVLAIRVGAWWVPVFAGAAGIVYAADQAAVKVINLSWGGYSPDPYIFDAIQYATVTKGKIVVAAAGNDDTTDPLYPAAYPNVIAVGATEPVSAGGCPIEVDVRKACFSNYGDYVDIAAPGVDILSTVPGADYEFYSGTSMASPFVAGAAALVWGKWPTLTRQQVIDLLITTGDPVDPDICEGHAFPVNVKQVNVYNAFAAKMTMPPAGGALVGLVVDANNGLPLGGATVTAKSGAITRTATTRADGTFTITNMPAGIYTVTASKSGYIATADETTWDVPEGCWNLLPFFALPKTQASDVWTAVLEWRGWCDMYELDSYLWLPGTLPPRNQYMVFWVDRGNMNVHPHARLLRDEPSEMPFRPWGPLYVEALTFRTRYTGTYTFAVHDFNGHGNWCCSDAVVRLYRGSTLVGTYKVCEAGGEEEGEGVVWWKVFQVSGTTVTPINQLTSEFPGPYGEEYFISASQRKPAVPGPNIPQGEYEYQPR